MMLRILSLLFSITLLSPLARAEAIQTTYNNLVLNAMYEDTGRRDVPAFLILHGTWATHNMLIISSLQSLLKEAELPSLGISLSLNVSDRREPQACNTLVTAGQNDNVAEIKHWIDYLEQQGFKEVIVMAHSRGGAQLATYTSSANDPRIKAQVLIAPSMWQADEVSVSLRSLAEESQSGMLEDVRVLHCKEASISAQHYRSYYLDKPEKNTANLILNSKLPTYIYLGSEDKSHTEKMLARSEELEKNANIHITVIDDADHFFSGFGTDDIVENLLERLE